MTRKAMLVVLIGVIVWALAQATYLGNKDAVLPPDFSVTTTTVVVTTSTMPAINADCVARAADGSTVVHGCDGG